jgi:ankyrin repeat protein
MNENGDIAEALLSAGASVDVCDSEGHTIVDACVTEGRTRLLPLLLEQPGAAGVLLSTTDTHGRTPLHVACALGNVHAANVLAAYGADIDAADRDGMEVE